MTALVGGAIAIESSTQRQLLATLTDMREYVDGDYRVPRHVVVRWIEELSGIVRPDRAGAAALLLGAQTMELYDDATSLGDYMLDGDQCAGILMALTGFVATNGAAQGLRDVAALTMGARVLGLYGDAVAAENYVLDADECAEITRALAAFLIRDAGCKSRGA